MSQAVVPVPAQPGLYIGGLRNDLHPARLAALICALLRKFQVQVAHQYVHINYKANSAYVLVELQDVSTSHYLLSQLSCFPDVNIVFDLSKITFDPYDFKVGPKLTSSLKKQSRPRSRSKSNPRNMTWRQAAEAKSNTSQCSSGHSIHADSKRKSRSRNKQGNDTQRTAWESVSDAAHISSSNLSTSGAASVKPARSSRPRKRGRRKRSAEAVSCASRGRAVHRDLSDISQHSEQSCSSSPPEEALSDSDESSPTSDTASKDPSNLTMSSKESDSKGSQDGKSAAQPVSSKVPNSKGSEDGKSVAQPLSPKEQERKVKDIVKSQAQPLSLKESDSELNGAGKSPAQRVSSKELDHKVSDAGKSLAGSGSKPLAGGVRRLLDESKAEAVVDPNSKKTSAVVELSSKDTSTTALGPSVSANTSTVDSLVDNFYKIGQIVGRETRTCEFKQGGRIFVERFCLEDTVGSYTCGFLNSGEGGTLYFGVNDNGEVVGLNCSQKKEDDFRKRIDSTLKQFDPPILTDLYTVRFVPVMMQNGRLSETLQVIEVKIKKVRNVKRLYVFRGDAYLRRDGSVERLKAKQVQEWTRQKLERDNSTTLLKSQLREMTKQLDSERKKRSQMEEKLTELQSTILQLTEALGQYSRHV